MKRAYSAFYAILNKMPDANEETKVSLVQQYTSGRTAHLHEMKWRPQWQHRQSHKTVGQHHFLGRSPALHRGRARQLGRHSEYRLAKRHSDVWK